MMNAWRRYGLTMELEILPRPAIADQHAAPPLLLLPDKAQLNEAVRTRSRPNSAVGHCQSAGIETPS
jgi:hypothetical protein